MTFLTRSNLPQLEARDNTPHDIFVTVECLFYILRELIVTPLVSFALCADRTLFRCGKFAEPT